MRLDEVVLDSLSLGECGLHGLLSSLDLGALPKRLVEPFNAVVIGVRLLDSRLGNMVRPLGERVLDPLDVSNQPIGQDVPGSLP